MAWSATLLTAVSAIFPGCSAVSSHDTVVFASGADLESANPLVTIHPLARQVQRHVLFVTLTRLDSSLVVQPYLARRWSWSADRRELRLHLVQDLRWHDGEPTTARDVAFTLRAARDPATGFPRFAEAAAIDSAMVVDDSTLVLSFRSAPPELPLLLSELPIVPEHLLRDVPHGSFRRDPFSTSPTGNGPFRFVRREPGRRWIFQRVEDFPEELGGPARLERLVVAIVDEATTKFAGLVSGDLQVAGIAPAMAALTAADPSLRLISYPVLFSTAVVFNSSRPPFNDVRVRRAVDALINRERIIDVAIAGYGTVATGPVSPDHPDYRAERRMPVGEAARLLDEAGWELHDGVRQRDGSAFSFTLLTVGSSDSPAEQLIQADLRSAGIEMNIRQMELGAFLAAARQQPKDFDALYTGIGGDLALSHIVAMFDSRLAGGALDYAGFHTGRLDSLFVSLDRAADGEDLRHLWFSIQDALAASVPVSWIYHARGVQGVSRRLEGVRMDLRGEMATIHDWYLQPGARP